MNQADYERMLARLAKYGFDDVREELVELSEDDIAWFQREAFARARMMRQWYGAPHCGDLRAAPDIPVQERYL